MNKIKWQTKWNQNHRMELAGRGRGRSARGTENRDDWIKKVKGYTYPWTWTKVW